VFEFPFGDGYWSIAARRGLFKYEAGTWTCSCADSKDVELLADRLRRESTATGRCWHRASGYGARRWYRDGAVVVRNFPNGWKHNAKLNGGRFEAVSSAAIGEKPAEPHAGRVTATRRSASQVVTLNRRAAEDGARCFALDNLIEDGRIHGARPKYVIKLDVAGNRGARRSKGGKRLLEIGLRSWSARSAATTPSHSDVALHVLEQHADEGCSVHDPATGRFEASDASLSYARPDQGRDACRLQRVWRRRARSGNSVSTACIQATRAAP
jgi:hypothetical protein